MLERIHPEIPDEWYQSGSTEANALGFHEDLFYGHVTRKGNTIILHYIYSLLPSNGNVQKFLQHLIDERWDIIIVNPNDTMQHICEKFGFAKIEEDIDGL